MKATLEWFGTATWRLVVGETVYWLDAYVDRSPTAAPLRLRGEEIDAADYVIVGHAHFDHVAEAGLIARNTGAVVVGSALTCEVVRGNGVSDEKLIEVSGGEELQLGPVTLRVYPSLHGFNMTKEYPDAEGRSYAEREAELRATNPAMADAAKAHIDDAMAKQPEHGGPLAFLLEWDDFRVFWHDTPGMVTESWEAASEEGPDVAILSVAGAFSTPNLDGNAFEGSREEFVAQMATLLQPGRVILNHHDDWCPPLTCHVPEEPFRPLLEVAGTALQIVRLGEVVELE